MNPLGPRTPRARVIAATLALAACGLATAHAQERHAPHWVFDARYGHRHYYPAVGFVMSALPPGYVAVGFRGRHFFFNAGVWFEATPGGYVVVRPPIGIAVPVLPPGYTVVWAAGVPYYYADEVYYAGAPGGGYIVTAPPTGIPVEPESAAAPPPPAAAIPAPAAPEPAAATWYYCESAKAYYPYVSSCAEGWRKVPATPPGVTQPR
jgi:hypothetical protein